MAALISASPAALAMARDYPLDRNPAAVYLSTLSRTGRATMRSSPDIAAGLRRAEICALKVSDFDGVNKTLVVRGKGNKQRELPANANIVAALEDWLLARGAAGGPLFCPGNKSGRGDVRPRG